MKMRGRRNSGWYAGCGCWLPGARGSRAHTERYHEKREVEKEIEEQLEEDKYPT